MLSRPYQRIRLVITIQKKYSLTYLQRTLSFQKRSSSNVWLYRCQTGKKKVHFCLQWTQNVRLDYMIQNQHSLPFAVCLIALVMPSLLLKHNNETSNRWQTILILIVFKRWTFETIASKSRIFCSYLTPV